MSTLNWNLRVVVWAVKAIRRLAMDKCAVSVKDCHSVLPLTVPMSVDPLKYPISDPVGDDGPVSPTDNLDRWYVDDDAEFLAQVAEMTLPEASKAAGIPIGAAVSDGLGGMTDYIPTEY
ncbi:expressed unknown protein [Seminavis robusta]|uniref:Uncharacterized protein n=1 Tax=Seminavis robusta TaxID=568900 RepID=A0A9N8EGW4_9STRA|nr:expressed unknown protein [Seminavis robusta]|eukprot:Sro1111_g242460.1 n/a (119) ;mRNA; f:25862-26218